jgi:flagellar basal body-associated protein FliL
MQNRACRPRHTTIAWIEQSALILVLIVLAVVGIGAVLWWHWRENRQVSGL